MPNIFQTLGRDYVNEFYHEAMFSIDGEVYLYGGLPPSSSEVRVHKLLREEPRWSPCSLSEDVFEDMSTFSWPTLGYREFPSSEDASPVYYIHTHRSALRGLRRRFLVGTPVDCMKLRQDMYDFSNISSEYVADAIFNPKFTPFVEGMEKLRAGVTPSFALNQNVAVAISVYSGNEVEVLYKGTVIGSVLGDNRVKVPNKIIKRSGISSLFGDRLYAYPG